MHVYFGGAILARGQILGLQHNEEICLELYKVIHPFSSFSKYLLYDLIYFDEILAIGV